MHVTARVGAIHLGWDVVSVAAGGGGTPIRPVQVEGTYTPPAYLLADKSGRLHTAGVDRQRPDLGIAVSDVRDILGHQQIRIAGATWPAELVFRARLYNPLAAIGTRLRGKPDVVALPFPDDWPDEKVEEYCRLIERMDVVTDPLPESVALSGYVRALGLVQPPVPGRRGIGATGVYSDGRVCLVVAVDGDDEQPTESVGVPIAPDSMRDAHAADNVVIEVMAAARSIGADTSTVLLTGNVCFNDALRLAFQNHLGQRLRVADHPMHALVLGAAHLLVTDSEYAEAAAQPPEPTPPRPAAPPAPAQPAAGPRQDDPSRHAWRGSEAGSAPNPQYQQPPRRTEPPANPPDGRHAAHDSGPRSAPQPRVPGEPSGDLGSRFTRPPEPPADEQRTTVMGRRPDADPAAGRSGGPSAGADAESDEHGHKGKLWSKVKDNLFGAPTIAGAVALAAVGICADGNADLPRVAADPVVNSAMQPAGTGPARSVEAADPAAFDAASVGTFAGADGFGAWPAVEQAAQVPDATPECSMTMNAGGAPSPNVQSVAERGCAHLAIDNLRYVVPTVPGITDAGPPMHI
ncbi:hypothetical protein [Nocardia veterana]|uniref:hypothetical protein n=1 Tax=Nocardia veterana TaxID=132249 RepID=UPI001FF7FB6B|nr:hypothetical protein [Nocardia veterana]